MGKKIKWKGNERGLGTTKIKDTRGCVLRLSQSSCAEQDCIWLFTEDPNRVYSDGKPAPHLNKRQARKLVKALKCFIHDRY